MRRLIIEEPVSRAALWAPRVAWFALAVTLMAVAVIRFQLVELMPGVAALVAGLFLAVEAAGLALFAFVRIWMEGRRGLGMAIRGLVLALLILGYPGYFAVRALIRPPLNDISTDIDDPPTFSRSRAALEARGGRVPPDVAPEARRLQRQAYPQIAPLTLDLPADRSTTSSAAPPRAAAGRSSRRRGRAAASASAGWRRSTAPSSCAFPTTSPCASAPAPTAPASTCAPPRASASTISARTRSASSASSRRWRTSPSPCSRRTTGQSQARRYPPSRAGGPSVATTPRAARSSRWAKTDKAAAPTRAGERPR